MRAASWLRANLFGSWGSAAVTLLLGAALAWGASWLIRWALLDSVWSVPHTAAGAPDPARCRQAAGACWAVLGEKLRFILFGFYPYGLQWRPAVAVLIFVLLYVVSSRPRFWRAGLAAAWAAGLASALALMAGGLPGLPAVPPEQWGGLPVTLILASCAMAFAFPLGIAAALGRRARSLPAVRLLCVGYIELIRGVPLISLLFMASVMLPLFLPHGLELDKLLRAQIAIILFAGAYLAEVVRGGLQALPRGQHEAAAALGLSWWQATRRVMLPQALRHVVPMLLNTFIGLFKDTSLVLIIGIFDLMTAGRAAILEPAWQGFAGEVYLFLGLIYFGFCFALSRTSRRLEARA